MRILVVGSSGYIGRHIVQDLVALGAEVVGFDVVPPLPQWAIPGVKSVQGNMAHLDEVMAAIVEHSIDRIVIQGYYMTPLLAPECHDLLNAARVNIIGVTNLFEAARLTKIERVVFASTIGLFGSQKNYGPEKIDEDTVPRVPKTLYSLMKLLNNGMADRYAQTYGIQIVKVHSAAVIGPGNTAFSKRMIQEAALGRPGFGNWPSAGPRNIVGVADIARLYARIAVADRVRHDTYMGTGPAPTGNELAGMVRRYLPDAHISFDERAHVPAWNFDNSRAVREFDWRIQPVEAMVLNEINGTRLAAGLPPVGA